MPGREALALLSLLTALALGACGGGDDGDGSPSRSDDGPLTAAEYRKQANALCVEGKAANDAIPRPTSEDGFVDYVEEGFDTGNRFDKKFARLEPPPSLRSAHERAVRILDEQREATDATVRRLRKAPDPVLASGVEIKLLRVIALKARPVRRELGLDKCIELEEAPRP